MLCTALSRSLEHLRSPMASSIAFSRKVRGRDSSANEILVARLAAEPVPTTLRVVRSGGASWYRTLEVIAPGGTMLAAMVSPLGRLRGARSWRPGSTRQILKP